MLWSTKKRPVPGIGAAAELIFTEKYQGFVFIGKRLHHSHYPEVEDYEKLYIKASTVTFDKEVLKACPRSKLAEEKRMDLQKMLKYVPQEAHGFYYGLFSV